MNDERNNNSNKNESFIGKVRASFSGRKFRSGAYVTMISTIIVIIVLVINLFVSELDLKLDLSTQELYTLTDKSVELVKDIDDNITIYYLAETGTELSLFQKIVEKYGSLSPNIKVVNKDPILYPKFASEYVNNEITQNSILVVNNSNGRAKYIDNSELLVQEFSYQRMEYVTTGIDVEGKVTSALQYVTDADLPVIYVVEGHREKELGELFKSTLEKQNVTIKTLSTLTQTSIPEDCDILYIQAPETDFTDSETNMIREYMAAGGNVVIVLDYMAMDLVNLKSLMDYYGVNLVEGVVFEGDSNRHVPSYPHFLVPEVLKHEITQEVIDSKKYVITPVASGLSIVEGTRSSLQVTPLLVTSDKAFSKVDIQSKTVSKEDGDVEGPFYLGLLATDSYNNLKTNMVVLTSELIFDDSSVTRFGNAELLTNTFGFLSGKANAISIRTRSVRQEYISITQNRAMMWGALVVIVIPALIIAAGVIVTLRRRRR